MTPDTETLVFQRVIAIENKLKELEETLAKHGHNAPTSLVDILHLLEKRIIALEEIDEILQEAPTRSLLSWFRWFS